MEGITTISWLLSAFMLIGQAGCNYAAPNYASTSAILIESPDGNLPQEVLESERDKILKVSREILPSGARLFISDISNDGGSSVLKVEARAGSANTAKAHCSEVLGTYIAEEGSAIDKVLLSKCTAGVRVR